MASEWIRKVFHVLLWFGRICEELTLIFFKYLVEFTSEAIWASDFLCEKVLTLLIQSLHLLQVCSDGLLKTWVYFGHLRLSSKWSISSSYSICERIIVVHIIFYNPLHICKVGISVPFLILNFSTLRLLFFLGQISSNFVDFVFLYR